MQIIFSKEWVVMGNITKKLIKPICGFAVGILNGMFGAGGGVIAVFFLEKFLNIEPKKAHAAAVLIILIVTPVSLFFYIKNGYADYKTAIWAALGGVIGGLLGAKILNKINDKILHGVFAVFLIIAAYRMFI